MTDQDTGDSLAEAPPSAYRPLEAEEILRAAIDLIERARPMPMSASSIINKNEVLELLNAAVQSLPDEFRAARWLLKERDDFLARVQGEGDLLIARARDTAQRMVQRTELVKEANDHARRVVSEAEQEARDLRLKTEDWCDQELGRLEVVLERISRSVAFGRSRMQGATQSQEPTPQPQVPQRDEFFDQDRE
ncbi:MAG: hypothetical protein F4Y27_08165 [Acidimicrobiaceae bacterium]|nr:hypothetical protein [Acidimicrobiaceae bacterium]MXW62409.1 hypothetical protein [Acidimicrobiaceae bacterium]MXW76437.1 hypothetical protein [Acidimicrobiaceae bacterium]MYA74635.1 hypothetical protein [Acidimicrobiaceae bacterium]MYC41455.1 hypothetical protein [Acidimicrobiaceae bacterium]